MATFTSQTPHFFKIILHQHLSEGKIEVPKKFVMNHGDSLLHRTASLRLPSGAKWEVELKKSDGKIWFGRGWPEFVEFHSVKLGYFVVFRYEGNSCFDVVVFDLSATEINYPVPLKRIFNRRGKLDRSRREPLLVPKSENEEDEDGGDSILRKRRRERDQDQAPMHSSLRKMKKIMRKNVKILKNRFATPQRFNDEDEEEEEEEDPEMNYSRWQKKFRVSNYRGNRRFSPESMRPEQPPRTTQPITEDQELIIRRASSFKFSTQNPSFMVTMRPSYIQTGNYLSLPRNFAERYLKESVDVKLELADGRVWRVWCGVRWAFTRRRTELKSGWKQFAVETNLQEGDVCVFELINRTTKVVLFSVTIFRLPRN